MGSSSSSLLSCRSLSPSLAHYRIHTAVGNFIHLKGEVTLLLRTALCMLLIRRELLPAKKIRVGFDCQFDCNIRRHKQTKKQAQEIVLLPSKCLGQLSLAASADLANEFGTDLRAFGTQVRASMLKIRCR